MGTLTDLATPVVDGLDEGSPLERVQLGGPQLAQEGGALPLVQEDGRTALANILEDNQGGLEEANVVDGQGQLDIAKVARTVGQLAAARLAYGLLIRSPLGKSECQERGGSHDAASVRDDDQGRHA